MTEKMYIVIDLEIWGNDPEALVKSAKILGKEDALIILTPYGFPEHRAVRFLVEVEQIVPEEWDDRIRGIFYGGTPENPRINFTKSGIVG